VYKGLGWGCKAGGSFVRGARLGLYRAGEDW
jgi:hypothetical protein